MIIAEINETIPNLPKPSAMPYMNPSAISDIYAIINKIIIVILIVIFLYFSSFLLYSEWCTIKKCVITFKIPLEPTT